MSPAAGLAVFAVTYLIGALPLGYRAARTLGRNSRFAMPHNVGVVASTRALGWPLAALTFVLDGLKGALAAGLAATVGGSDAALMASLAAYAGHLNPPPLLRRHAPSRARGSAVLLGASLGLTAFAGLSPWAASAAVLAWTSVVLASGFVALGTLAGLVTFALAVAFDSVGPPGRAALVALVACAVWRFKENLGRMLDRAEPLVLEASRARPARADSVVVAAFLMHPLSLSDFWKSRRFAWAKPLHDRGWLRLEHLEWLGARVRPFKVGELRGIRTPDGREVRCHLLSAPLTPRMFHLDPDLAVRRAVQGARLAQELGATVCGLGAFWGTVGRKGADVQAAVPELIVTNGGAYTAGSVRAAIPRLLEHFRGTRRDPRTATVAVLGANGVVAFGMARMIAPEFGTVVLVGRDLGRVDRSRATLEKAFPGTRFVSSVDPHDCRKADLILSATSDPEPVLFGEHVKPGAWILDVGRPADADRSVLEVEGVRLFPGGVVRPPGAMSDSGGWATGKLDFGDGLVPACLAEALIIGATGARERCSLGDATRTDDIHYFVLEAERLGFQVVEEISKLPAGGRLLG